MDEKILLKIYESTKCGETVAMAVITDEVGSSPRKSGSIMAIWKNGQTLGSVGGGKIEYVVINKAVECIKKKVNDSFEYSLNRTGIGMVCGGMVKGYIKVFYPQNKLIITGAGHIGEQLNKIAKILGFYTVVIDDRIEFANKERFGDADEIIVHDEGEAIKNYQIQESDYIVIVTNAHVKDKAVLQAVVNKKVAYIGMIGSAKKIRFVMNELIEEGVDGDKLRGVYAPMGLDIASNTPEEIAFAILSEILLIKNNGSLNHRKNKRKVWD